MDDFIWLLIVTDACVTLCMTILICDVCNLAKIQNIFDLVCSFDILFYFCAFVLWMEMLEDNACF